MVSTLTYAVIGGSVVLMFLAVAYAVADRLMDDLMLGVSALLTVALIVQVVFGLRGLARFPDADTSATFAAYLITLPFLPLATGFLALKEKTRWAMAALAVGAFSVAVMTVRLDQMWSAHGAG